MIKHLKFHKIQAVERRGALMLVWFLDDEGNMYDWAPKWNDVEKIFLKQINVERFNKPESQWLNKFAKTAQEVVEGAQRIESATKLYGKFQRYEEQKLIIESKEEQVTFPDVTSAILGSSGKPEIVTVEGKVTPGFEVTMDFLDEWVGENVEVFIVNGIAIRIRVLGEWDRVLKEYPPPEGEMPF